MGQTEAAIANTLWALEKAGSNWDEVVYLKITVADREVIHQSDPVIRQLLPEPRPASAAIKVAGLMNEENKIVFDVWARHGAQRVQAD